MRQAFVSFVLKFPKSPILFLPNINVFYFVFYACEGKSRYPPTEYHKVMKPCIEIEWADLSANRIYLFRREDSGAKELNGTASPITDGMMYWRGDIGL